ncbi:MAG: DUF5615 family PIN-like protein [Steroidobacteraceae bacterium]
MLRLLADENFDHDVMRGVLRRRPQMDIIRVQEVGLSEMADPEVLAWAADERRITITHDVNSMVGFAIEWIRRCDPLAGLFAVHQATMEPSRIIEDLLLLDECSETVEWADRVLYLPLR